MDIVGLLRDRPTASRFAEHPVDEPPGQPRLVRAKTIHSAGRDRSKIPGAKRRGSIELLGARTFADCDQERCDDA